MSARSTWRFLGATSRGKWIAGPNHARVQPCLWKVSPIQRHNEVRIRRVGAGPERGITRIRSGFHGASWLDPFRLFPQQIDDATDDRRANPQCSQDGCVFVKNLGGHDPSERVVFNPVAQKRRAGVRRLDIALESRDAGYEY
jgi:hypothetical protein